jgi:hypothetical protein
MSENAGLQDKGVSVWP